MRLPPGHLRAFRKTFDVSIEAYSHEEFPKYLRERVGDILLSDSEGIELVIEEISGWEDRREPVRKSDRGIPLYPAKATIAALTESRVRADAIKFRLRGA